MPPAFVSTFAAPSRAASPPLRRTSFQGGAVAPAPRAAAPSQRARSARTHAPAMFFDFFKPFQRKDRVALPQNDREHATQRAESVAANRAKYEWTNDAIGDASLIKGLPDGENPNLGWIEDLAFIVIRVALNSISNSTEEATDAVEENILAAVSGLVSPVLYKLATAQFSPEDAREANEKLKDIVRSRASGTGVTIEDYKDLFSNIKLDTVAKLDQFLRDDIFGWYRVAGPNPMRLTKLNGKATDMFPELTNDVFKGIVGFSGDTLEAAAADGRLYYVDYPEFDGLPVGKDADGNLKGSFNYASKCLLAVPLNVTDRLTVLPIAIRCGQDSTFPMFTANPDHTDPVTWLACKLTIQVSDSVIHETVYHLGRTHLMLEVFVCSTYRTLPEQHPLHRLLKIHFYGTAFINNAAVSSLINDNGTIDQITAPPVSISRQISASAVNDKNFSFNDWMPDKELASRGVMDGQLKYPYRDDALVLWPALNKWVRAFVTAYYKSDADVAGDNELANWCKEIVGPGQLHGFGETADGRILTVDYLVRAVSMVIFTASVQHAAVNFPQSTMMQFAPAMPLGGYAPAPTEAKPFSSVNDWVTKMMPNLEKAERQLTTAELIGVLKYSTFGEYGKSLQFAPDEVDDALEEFQEDLGIIGARIQERNVVERRAGLPVYNYLVPKNIPQSINI